MSARRILASDFEVTIIENDHLSINGVRAKGINYFREKSLDFFVQRDLFIKEWRCLSPSK